MTRENDGADAGLSRRPLLKVAAGGAVLTAAAGVASRLAGDGPAPGRNSDGVLALTSHPDSDVQSLRLPLQGSRLNEVGPRRWASRRLPTSTHSMVAFTWTDQDTPPTTGVRTRRSGTWSSWLVVPPLLDVPDGEESGPGSVRGTDLVWIGRADGIQIRVDGRRPTDLALVLLYPEARDTDNQLGAPAGRGARSRSTDEKGVRRPELVTRKEWGANEKLRDGDPTYNHALKQVHVHHTVNANDYSRRDVPALIRGMYAYHTQTLGWSDIGYNFLVDRFGRGFVGRAGGPRRLVRGAHTLGFNAESTGISAIGNYETAQPTRSMLDAIAGIAAWKLDRFERDPRGTIRVESEGSDRYATGRTVRLPIIDGHRDTNDTACPGRHLYEALPKIRRRAARLVAAANQKPIMVEKPAAITGASVLGKTLIVDPGVYSPSDAEVDFQWLKNGVPLDGQQADTYVIAAEDVGAQLSCFVTLTGPDYESVVQRPVSPGPVLANPVLRVSSRSTRRRSVRVQIAVEVPAGVTVVPGGLMTVTVGDRLKTVSLNDGRASVTFGRRRPFRRGRHDVRVSLPASTPLLPGEWAGRVRVP